VDVRAVAGIGHATVALHVVYTHFETSFLELKRRRRRRRRRPSGVR
jgi:hypothetical protein